RAATPVRGVGKQCVGAGMGEDLGIQPEPVGHAPPQRGEVPGLVHQDAVAGAQGVAQGRLPGAGSRCRIDRDRVSRPEDPAHTVEDRQPELAELGAPMIDGRLGHGPQDALRHRARPGNLEEMATGGVEVERGHGGSVRAGWIACKMHRGECPTVARRESARPCRRAKARGGQGSVMSSASVRHHASVAGTTLPPSDACETLARRLRAETRGEVLFDAASRGRYATDASIYQIMPVGVFVPTCEDDIAIALQVAGQLGVPVLPRGAGTSQCGQTVGAALVIDNSRHIRGILSVDVDARVAEVEPGLVLDELNRALRRHGLWFPVDVSTSAQATLGGMAGNNSCGSRSIAYGNMVHNVLGVRAWMADGELLRFGPVAQASGRAARIAEFVAGLVRRHRTAIHENWPTVMRRVGGYNLDI